MVVREGEAGRWEEDVDSLARGFQRTVMSGKLCEAAFQVKSWEGRGGVVPTP